MSERERVSERETETNIEPLVQEYHLNVDTGYHLQLLRNTIIACLSFDKTN